MEYFEIPGHRGDDRCLGSGFPARQWARIDGKYVVRLPLTTVNYDRIYTRVAKPPEGQMVEFEVTATWLPNCGYFTLPDGRTTFMVRDHDIEVVA
jgi:hypothetical protein